MESLVTPHPLLNLKVGFHLSHKYNIYEINTPPEVLAKNKLHWVAVIITDVCLGRTGLWQASLRNYVIKWEHLKGSSHTIGFTPSAPLSSSVFPICLISLSGLLFKLTVWIQQNRRPREPLALVENDHYSFNTRRWRPLSDLLMPRFLLCSASVLTMRASKTCVGRKPV